MRQSPHKRQLSHKQTSHSTTGARQLHRHTWHIAVIILEFPLLALLGIMLYVTPGLAGVIVAMAGIVSAPIVIPYIVVRLVTAILDRQTSARHSTSRAEPTLNPEPDRDPD